MWKGNWCFISYTKVLPLKMTQLSSLHQKGSLN